MKNIFKAIGITLGVTTLIFLVGYAMGWVMNMIQEGFNLSGLQMAYGLGSFLLILLFGIVYYVINQKTKEEKAKLKIVEDDIKAKRSTKEIERQKKVLYDVIDQWAAEFHIPEYLSGQDYPELRIDDIVIPNKYGVIKDSSNAWDSGATGIITYAGTKAPFTCKVTGIRVSTGHAKDCVDQLLDHATFKYDSDEEMIKWFELHMDGHHHENFTDNRGLYVEVFFDTIDIDFQPIWGLNVFSFLPIDSEEGKKTHDTWKEIYLNDVLRQKLREQEDALIDDNNKLFENLTNNR